MCSGDETKTAALQTALYVGRSEGEPDESRVPQLGDSRVACCARLKVVLGGVTSEKVRVVVGDDHPLFRDGVVRALTSSGSIEVVAEADDGPVRT